jgi:DnaK suppressor protein
LSEGGTSFSAARIEHQGATMKNRKEAMLSMHKVLIKRRDALRKALAGDLSLLNSVQDEISSQLAEVESRELARIENALQRMRDGHYGSCETCGCSIPMARLNALPYATLCIKCQREAEQEGAPSRMDVDWSRLLDVNTQEADLSINDIELDVS